MLFLVVWEITEGFFKYSVVGAVICLKTPRNLKKNKENKMSSESWVYYVLGPPQMFVGKYCYFLAFFKITFFEVSGPPDAHEGAARFFPIEPSARLARSGQRGSKCFPKKPTGKTGTLPIS